MRRGISAAVMCALLIACAIPSSRVLAPSYGPVADQPETPVAVLTGIATWYDASKNHAWYTRTTKHGPPIKFYASAGPELRQYTPNSYLMKPYHIIVKSVKTGRVIDVWIVDWCGCYGRTKSGHRTVVDFAPAVWKALGVPLNVGIMAVEITIPKPRVDGSEPCPYSGHCP